METLFQIGQIVVVYQQLYHEFTECLISVAILSHTLPEDCRTFILSFYETQSSFCFLQRSFEFMKCLKLFYDANIL
jgi:ABC-type uncharacterized transport system permease subunit